jgi:hypothetical protein
MGTIGACRPNTPPISLPNAVRDNLWRHIHVTGAV